MFSQRALSVAFYAAMACIVAICGLNLDVTYRAISGETWAAWVQAFGSIGVIVGAALIANRQQRSADRERKRVSRVQRQILATRVRFWAAEISAKSSYASHPSVSDEFFLRFMTLEEQDVKALATNYVFSVSVPLKIDDVSSVDAPDIHEAVLILLQRMTSYNQEISKFRPRFIAMPHAKDQWDMLALRRAEIGTLAMNLTHHLGYDARGFEQNPLLMPPQTHAGNPSKP